MYVLFLADVNNASRDFPGLQQTNHQQTLLYTETNRIYVTSIPSLTHSKHTHTYKAIDPQK